MVVGSLTPPRAQKHTATRARMRGPRYRENSDDDARDERGKNSLGLEREGHAEDEEEEHHTKLLDGLDERLDLHLVLHGRNAHPSEKDS